MNRQLLVRTIVVKSSKQLRKCILGPYCRECYKLGAATTSTPSEIDPRTEKRHIDIAKVFYHIAEDIPKISVVARIKDIENNLLINFKSKIHEHVSSGKKLLF